MSSKRNNSVQLEDTLFAIVVHHEQGPDEIIPFEDPDGMRDRVAVILAEAPVGVDGVEVFAFGGALPLASFTRKGTARDAIRRAEAAVAAHGNPDLN